jgi:hypothetical protein
MGKGSHRRNEDVKKIWDNWDAIFKKEKKEHPGDLKEEKPNRQEQPEQKDAK